MSNRKIWLQQEDRALKQLRQERGILKWNQIAKVLQQQFQIFGRTQKQCRERYHNHLDQSIVNKEWTKEESELLFTLHDQIGSKWALIASRLPGRADNTIKNHFYSKFRKAARKINKIIKKQMKNQYKQIKGSTLSIIFKATEAKYRSSSKADKFKSELSNKIMKNFRQYEDNSIQFKNQNEEFDFIKDILTDIGQLDKDIVKKQTKKRKGSNDEQLLKPPLMFQSLCYQKKFLCSQSSDSVSSSYLSAFSGNEDNWSQVDGSYTNSSKSKKNLLKPHLALTKSSSGILEKKQPQNFLTKSMEIKPRNVENYPNITKLIKENSQNKEKICIQKMSSESVNDSSNHSSQGVKSKSSKNSNKKMVNYMFYEDINFHMNISAPKEMSLQQKLEISGLNQNFFNLNIQDQMKDEYDH